MYELIFLLRKTGEILLLYFVKEEVQKKGNETRLGVLCNSTSQRTCECSCLRLPVLPSHSMWHSCISPFIPLSLPPSLSACLHFHLATSSASPCIIFAQVWPRTVSVADWSHQLLSWSLESSLQSPLPSTSATDWTLLLPRWIIDQAHRAT